MEDTHTLTMLWERVEAPQVQNCGHSGERSCNRRPLWCGSGEGELEPHLVGRGIRGSLHWIPRSATFVAPM